MSKRNVKHKANEEVDEATGGQKVQWPYPVRTGSESSQKPMVLAVKYLSAVSKQQLWDFICKEDRALATLLKQVTVFETRSYEDAFGNKVNRHSDGFGISMTLLNEGADLQQEILQQKQVRQ